jgi:predicted dehydrogenase
MTTSLGLVGFGYWGPQLARNLMALPGCHLAIICDQSHDRLVAAAAAYPGTCLTRDWMKVVHAPDLAAVVIATPADRHFEIAMTALASGKHVLVEKPMAVDAHDVAAMIAEACRRHLVLMAAHTYIYSGPFEVIRREVGRGTLGDLTTYRSRRFNTGPVRTDTEVSHDLAIHDLSIIDGLLGRTALAVRATGLGLAQRGPDHFAHLTVFYPGDFRAEIEVSWSAPERERQVILSGTRRQLLWDDLRSPDPLVWLDHGSAGPAGDGTAPESSCGRDLVIPVREPLRAMVEAFVAAISRGEPVVTDGASGLRIARILEAALSSLASGGSLVAPAGNKVAT